MSLAFFTNFFVHISESVATVDQSNKQVKKFLKKFREAGVRKSANESFYLHSQEKGDGAGMPLRFTLVFFFKLKCSVCLETLYNQTAFPEH